MPDNVKIDAKNFPDEAFREKVRFFFDTNEDGFLSKEERNVIKDLDLNYDYSPRITESIELKDTSEWELYSWLKGRGVIRSLKGIEFFENLEKLDCSHNELTELDVSKNTKLKYLECIGTYYPRVMSFSGMASIIPTEIGEITTLDLSGNPELEYLNISDNRLTSLNLSSNPALTKLDCSGTDLTSLDVSNNPELVKLTCGGNRLSSVKFGPHSRLKYFSCGDSRYLTELDLSNVDRLEDLKCVSCNLTTLDISLNTRLKVLDCYDNELTELNLSQNPALETVDCGDNKLTSLDVSHNPMLTELDYRYNFFEDPVR